MPDPQLTEKQSSRKMTGPQFRCVYPRLLAPDSGVSCMQIRWTSCKRNADSHRSDLLGLARIREWNRGQLRSVEWKRSSCGTLAGTRIWRWNDSCNVSRCMAQMCSLKEAIFELVHDG